MCCSFVSMCFYAGDFGLKLCYTVRKFVLRITVEALCRQQAGSIAGQSGLMCGKGKVVILHGVIASGGLRLLSTVGTRCHEFFVSLEGGKLRLCHKIRR